MTKSEALRRRIIWHLRHVWVETWKTFDALADELGVHPVSVKREVHRLARAGRLWYSFMMNEDGFRCGSGYFLTAPWERHRPGRDEDPADDDFDYHEESPDA